MKYPLSCLKPLALAMSLTLAACGGGESDTAPPPSAVTLSGTAAAGAGLVGVVTVKGAKGNTVSSYIEANGNYQVDVSGLTPPYRLRAEGNIGGKRYVLHSYSESAGAGTTVNITPLTDLIIANAAGQIAASFFDGSTRTSLDPAAVKAQEQALRDKLKDVLTQLGVQASVDLLNTAFSADHSGLDAALDVLRVEVDPATQVATIRNIVDNTQITDNLQDPQDNTATLPATPAVQDAASNIQSILNIFKGLEQAFANGLPQAADIQQYFASNFLWNDLNRSLFLGMLTTDQNNIGLEFANVTVSNLDSTQGTAEVRFHVASGKLTSPQEELFYVQTDANSQWVLLGNQYTAGLWFRYHCNAPGGENTPAYCGINLNVDDTDPGNNGTNNVPYGSATVEILSPAGLTSATVYLGTPIDGTPGILNIWDEGQGMYTEDYKGFGNQLGQIDPSVFEAGGSVKFSIYTENLDTTTPASPMIPANAIPVVSYTLPILYAPSQQALLPKFDAATKTAIENYTPGTDLNLSWTAAPGTRVSEIFAELQDDLGQSVEFSKSQLEISTRNSLTILGSDLPVSLLSSSSTAYNLLIRLYAVDVVTGQDHSIDYTLTIGNSSAGGGTGTTPPPTGTTLTCGYQSPQENAVNSFADFEAVVSDCGTATPIAIADIAGYTFTSADGLSQTTFNNDVGKDGLSQATAKTGSNTDLSTGGSINFEWWIETATCTGCTHSYLVKYTNTTIDPNLATTTGGITEARETTAVLNQTGVTFDLATYSELSITGDMIRSSGSDGEIWNETVTRQ